MARQPRKGRLPTAEDIADQLEQLGREWQAEAERTFELARRWRARADFKENDEH